MLWRPSNSCLMGQWVRLQMASLYTEGPHCSWSPTLIVLNSKPFVIFLKASWLFVWLVPQLSVHWHHDFSSIAPSLSLSFFIYPTFCLPACCVTHSGNRSSKTFKPKKNIPEGSHQYELLKHAEATLGSGNLRMAVMLPEGEDLNEWVAVNSKH